MATPHQSWVKSSRCHWDSGQCVEVAATQDAVFVRDSKQVQGSRSGPVLEFTHSEWAMAVEAIKRGEFDIETLLARRGFVAAESRDLASAGA